MRRHNPWASRLGWLTAGLVSGLLLTASAAPAERAETLFRKLEVLAEVLGQIESHYVDATSPSELVYGAVHGAVAALDGHSAFFSPDEYRELLDSTEGEYAGIGIEISIRDQLPEVISVFDESPAHRAGIQTGDRIMAVDGEPVDSEVLDDVQKRLRGPAGSKVVLIINRPPRRDQWSFTLVRSWIRVAPLETRILEPGYGYVRIKTFARRVSSDLEHWLDQQGELHGLILDLRGNPGGLFDEAIAICDLFLEQGPIVSATGKGGRVLERQVAHRQGTQPDYPVAILIDGGSASAAEVVAGALRDRQRARLFGASSYGKGTVQSIIELSDGSGLKLTVARYLTPSGRRIDGAGIQPDESFTPEAEPTTDRPLVAAREWLHRGRD